MGGFNVSGFNVGATVVGKGYVIGALVSISLRFGNLLNPITGLSLNISLQSGLLLSIFQFL